MLHRDVYQYCGTTVHHTDPDRGRTSEFLPLLSRPTWGVKQINGPHRWTYVDVNTEHSEDLQRRHGMTVNNNGTIWTERQRYILRWTDRSTCRRTEIQRTTVKELIQMCDGDIQHEIQNDPDLGTHTVNGTGSEEQIGSRDLSDHRNRSSGDRGRTSDLKFIHE